MTLGERLLILRRRRGLSQGGLSKASGIHRNTIARLEQGDLKDLSGDSLIKLAKALSCTSDQLLGLAGIDPESEREAAAVV